MTRNPIEPVALGEVMVGGCVCRVEQSHNPDFSVGDWVVNYSGWLRQGKVHYKEQCIDGLEKAPQGLIDLLDGKNFGKVVIRVGNDRL